MEKSVELGKRGKYGGNKPAKRIRCADSDIDMDNFVNACKQVSQDEHFNYTKRLKLLQPPNCCHCSQHVEELSPMSPLLEHEVENEIKLNMWYEALDTCYYKIKPTQYLPANILMGIVEIMLNARENLFTKYSMVLIMKKCQQILSYHFNMHPPCRSHPNIMNCYKSFIKNCVIVRRQKYARIKFTQNHGIVRYCLDNLQYEMSIDSTEDPLYTKDYIELEYKKTFKDDSIIRLHSVDYLNWQQQNFEIFDMLNRTDRINRLISILYSIVELILYDTYFLVKNSNVHTSMLYELVSDKKVQEQIMKLFAYFIHLDYPEEHIKTMNLWLNATFEIFYFIDKNANQDYPLEKKPQISLESDFYEIIKKLPPKSVIKILERLEPLYMRYYVSRRYYNSQLKYSYFSVIETLCSFIQKSHWMEFNEEDEDFVPNNLKKDIKVIGILEKLSQICKTAKDNKNNSIEYKKFDEKNLSKHAMTQSDVIKTLYISLTAFLEAFSVKKVHSVAKQSEKKKLTTFEYEATASLTNIYKDINTSQRSLISLIQNIEAAGELPKILNCFKIIYM